MPSLKPNPNSENSDHDRPIWGAKAIAVEANRDERSVYYMLDKGLLDATKVGTLWTSTRRRIRRSLGVEA